MKDRKEQFEKLAGIIRTKSIQDALIWSPSNYVNSYQTTLGIGEVLITFNEEEPEYGDPIPEYSLSFINERGETIYSIDAYLSSDKEYDMLKDIYESAHDSYMRTEDTLKSMFDDIRLK